MEPTNDTNTEPVVAAVEMTSPATPKMIDLFKEGWNFVKGNFELLKWYLISLVVMAALSTEFVANFTGDSILSIVHLIAIIATIVFVALNTWTLMHAVSQPDVSQSSFKESLGWAKRNFFLLFWTSVLSGVSILAGYILLIIPGIILTVYLYFSLYAQVLGAGAGTKAIKQSYRVVKGRWWQTFGKLIVLGLCSILVYLVVGFIVSIVMVLFFEIFGVETEVIDLITAIIGDGILSAIVGGITMYALAQYYKYLKDTTTVPEQSQEVEQPQAAV